MSGYEARRRVRCNNLYVILVYTRKLDLAKSFNAIMIIDDNITKTLAL